MAILSIQSHVVFGYAGNSAAVFPMQRLGHEVWAVNTVDFSNHTGYGEWTGKVHEAELVRDLLCGLEKRSILENCEAVLSGYLGDASIGRAVIEAAGHVRSASPNALYCCDPVMGDAGRGFYVKSDIPEMFKNELIPLADIITPNQFELEALTGIEVNSLTDARRAIDALHAKGPKIVMVTSFLGNDDNGKINMLASGSGGIFSISTPKLPVGTDMAGSGDITAAVFLCRYLETRDIEKALELCTASIFGLIDASWRFYREFGSKNNVMELRIIQAQNEFNSPSC
ncbi:MAG: pyridoxal kinase PdxY, partial [Treponema sp.]|nr:pyridoxal kinase PdxY [Treponema sp.]